MWIPLAIVVAVIGGAAGVAGASSPSAWQVPAECGGPARLAARITAQAGRPLTEAEPISVDVTIGAREGGGYRGQVEVISVRGAARREVEGADCTAVVDAVALVLAVAMQDAPRQRVDVEEPVAPAPPAPPVFVVGAGLGVDRGALPAASPGAAVVIAFRRGPWRLELGGEIYQAAFAPTPADDRDGVDVSLLGGRARLCHRLGPVRACAGGAVGRLEGRPVGELGNPSTESRRWSALTAGLGWSYRFGGRFAVGVDVEGVVALDRPRFVVDEAFGTTMLHQPAAAGLRAGCGLEVEIR